MKNIITILLCVMTLNCYANENEITPTPTQAAIADTVSTVVALNNGFTESNPLGFATATGIKLVTLLYFNDEFEGQTKYQVEKFESSIWTGASVNNILLVVGATPFVAIGSGLITAITIWNNN